MEPTGIPVIDVLITIVTSLAALAVVVGGFIMAMRTWRPATEPAVPQPDPGMGDPAPAYGRRAEDRNDLHTRVALTEQGLKNLDGKMTDIKAAQVTERTERREANQVVHAKLDRQDTKLDTIIMNMPRKEPDDGA